MEGFEKIFRAERFVGFLKVDERLFGVFRNRGDGFIAESADAEDVEDQDTVIGGDGAPAFGNDRRVRDLGFVADVLDVVDDVVGIFLQSVVDAGFEVVL